MPRKPNYSFEKRQKEMQKKAKKEAKLLKKHPNLGYEDDEAGSGPPGEPSRGE